MTAAAFIATSLHLPHRLLCGDVVEELTSRSSRATPGPVPRHGGAGSAEGTGKQTCSACWRRGA